jgi:muconate cycloisomerase
MIIKQVDVWHLKCRFQYQFKHKLATHSGSDNLVVRVTTPQGIHGYGEGIPRDFVTGETLSDSFAFLREHLGPALLRFPTISPANLLPSLAVLQEKFNLEDFPGAFCALETALLDAAGQTWGRPLASFLGSRLNDAVTYSAVVPLAGGGPKLSRFFQLIKALGLRYVKLKVGEDNDLDTLSQARRELGDDVDLRVDANAAWSAAEAITRLRDLESFRLSAVEQPVAKEDFEGLRQVREAVNIPIIADESLCTWDDARRLIHLKACQIFNIRLSKVGGLTAAIRIKDTAEAADIHCQLGCHVGETSILAAAGRHFAVARGPLTYLEGCFAPFLLTRDPVQQSVRFGQGGVGLPLAGPGLGVQALEEALDEMAVTRITLS